MASFKGEKLMGRSNYIDWETNARLFLEINGFMPYIDGSEPMPQKELYYKDNEAYSPELAVKYHEKLSEFQRNSKKALGALKSIISIENIERFKEFGTAKLLWDAIYSMFAESSFELMGRYIDKLNTISYSGCKNMDEYTSQIQSAAYYLKQMNKGLNNAHVAWIIFRGLPSSFDAFSSRKYEEIGKTLNDLNISNLTAELIAEESRMNSTINANHANHANTANTAKIAKNAANKRQIPQCKFCNKKGHLEAKCYKKHPELKPTNNSSAVMTASMLTPIKNQYNWIVDSGASEHFTNQKEWLENYQTVDNLTVTAINGQKLQILGFGSIPITLHNTTINKPQQVTISKVYYVPNIAANLLSTKNLTEKGWKIQFHKDKCELQSDSFTTHALYESNAYILHSHFYAYTAKLNDSIEIIHQRLSHISEQNIYETAKHTTGLNISKIQNQHLNQCEPCSMGKQHEIVSYKNMIGAEKPFELIHTDIAGPFINGLKSEKYYISFTDDKTRLVWIYCMKFKSEAIDKMIEYYNYINIQTGYKIQRTRADNAGEYKSHKWLEFVKQKGIKMEYTAPYTPAQNGISERLNRTIIERTIAVMKNRNIPIFLWPEIMKSIVYIKNRTYSSVIKMTPYEALIGRRPDISNIRILGSLAYKLIPKNQHKKLDSHMEKCIIIGFESSNYKIYIPSRRLITTARDITINENNEFIDKASNQKEYDLSNLMEFDNIDILIPRKEPIIQIPDLTADNSATNQNQQLTDDLANQGNFSNQESENNESNNESNDDLNIDSDNESNNDSNIDSTLPSITVEMPRRSNRSNKGVNPRKYEGFTLLAARAFAEIERTDDISTVDFKEPQNFEEAMHSNEKDLWVKSMKREINTLKNNNTWKLVPKPKNRKPIKTKWVYKIKKNDDKSLEYKSRFVAKGFEQIYGIDYNETFAAVIKQMSFKVIFALCVMYDWYLHKVDMKSAFTQGFIKNLMYIEQPKGFEDKDHPDWVLLLNKALYGLKQSARIWYETLHKVLIKLGFMRLKSDSCIFKHQNKQLFITVYVDDLAICGPNINDINDIKTELANIFDIKDLGPIKSYLGIQIERNMQKRTMHIHQTEYIHKILNKFNMHESKPASTPMDAKINLLISDQIAEEVDKKWYQSAIGSLLYAALGTRPDILYATITLGKYASNPSQTHISSVKRIFRYLRKYPNLGIEYSNNPYLIGYADSDYAGDKSTYKSTSGYAFFFGNGPISFQSKLQSIVALSSTEAEYISLCNSAKEATFLQELLKEIGYYKQDNIPIYSDNNGAILLSQNPVFHARTKHINVRYHFIRQKVTDKDISVHYINTNQQKADGLTKALPKQKHGEFIKQLNMKECIE